MTRADIAFLLAAGGGGAFALSCFLTWLAIRVAPRFGYVDRPGQHKSHVEPTPYGGGVAIFLAAWAPMAALLLLVTVADRAWLAAMFGDRLTDHLSGLGMRSRRGWLVLGGGLVLHIMGVIDDRRALGPIVKLGVIAVVAVAVATWGQVRIAEFAGPAIAVGLTVVWLIVISNALNFLDNMDGLAAGVGCICTVFLIASGLLAHQVLIPLMATVFLGAMLGFLVFNFPPARIFMGDAGSLLIGYMLGVTAILTTYYQSGSGTAAYALAMPLVILAVPLYDCASVVTIRLSEGRNPMQGDQRHFSHRLVQRGLSRRAAVLTIYLATATTALAATLLPSANERETITIAVLVLLVLAIIAILEGPVRTGQKPIPQDRNGRDGP